MSWWDETQSRLLRSKSPMELAQTLLQRLEGVHLGGEGALAPALHLATVVYAAADLVKLTEGVLEAADADRAALRRQAVLLLAWAQAAQRTVEEATPPLAALLGHLDPADRQEAFVAFSTDRNPGSPAEQGKVDGRYRRWHLLFEQLDLKFASCGVAPSLARGLARALAELFDTLLGFADSVHLLTATAKPRRFEAARFLVDAHAAVSLSVGPRYLGMAANQAGVPAGLGLPAWLLLFLVETGGEGSVFNVSP